MIIGTTKGLGGQTLVSRFLYIIFGVENFIFIGFLPPIACIYNFYINTKGMKYIYGVFLFFESHFILTTS